MTFLVAELATDPQYGLNGASGTVTLTPHPSKKHCWRVAVQVSGMEPGDYAAVLVSHVGGGSDYFASTVRSRDDGTGAGRFTINADVEGTFVGFFSTSEYTDDPYPLADGLWADRRIESVTVTGRHPDENLFGTFK